MRWRTALAAGTALMALAVGTARAEEARFTPSPLPTTEAQMTGITAGAAVTWKGRSHPLPYRVLFRSGDRVGGRTVALVIDRTGAALPRSLPAGKEKLVAEGPFHANAPDANSLIRTKDGLFLLTHFEYHPEAPGPDGRPVDLYARLPMLMTLARLEKATGGILSARRVETVDSAGVDGLWIPCGATLTPWNSHLGAEEYEPDARAYEAKPLEPMNLFRGTAGKTAAQGGADPYRYGYLFEASLGAKGKAALSKRLVLGRLSHELGDVMPDGRTVYLADDGRDTGFYLFVADRPADLTAGTLYAARWNQRTPEAGGSADLDWIPLGHATEKDIRGLLDRPIRISDIFEAADRPAEGFTTIQAYHGTGGGKGPEHLRVKPGMEQAAAFLETRRFAALRGATTEFTKMEGLTHSVKGRRLYSAMSYIEGAMLEGGNETHPADHIRLSGNKADLACGAVYESVLAGNRRDSRGRPIESEWVALGMKAVLSGAARPRDGAGQGGHDACDGNRIANPDNLKFSDALGALLIGEDSGNHLNNALWAWRPSDDSLARLMTAPAGGEIAGLQVVEDAGGHAYIMVNIQHPGASGDLKKYPPEVRDGLAARVDKRGVVGYLGPLPALK